VSTPHLAYLCLQATTEGQASYAHVNEIIGGLKRASWSVDLFQPSYAGAASPGVFGRLAEFSRVQRRLVRALKTGRYDALYIRGHALAWPAARAARRLGTPVVQECNGPYEDFYTMWPQARPFKAIIDSLTRTQFRWASARIAVTPQLARWIEGETGQSTDVVGNGANTEVFRPGAPNVHADALPARYAVLFGALSPWQGVDVLLEAANHDAWPADVSAVVVGDGVMRGAVEAAATRNPGILAAGSLPYAEVAGVVAASLCSLVLCNREGDWGLSPLKLYESMACGVPLVVPDLPGSADTVLEHGCGVVLDALDAEAVARAVSRMAANADERSAMGARGRAAVLAHYSWQARADATRAIIERVLDV